MSKITAADTKVVRMRNGFTKNRQDLGKNIKVTPIAEKKNGGD